MKAPGLAASNEAARIHEVYSRRESAGSADYYSWHREENQFRIYQTSRACIAALRKYGLFPLAGRKVLDVGCGPGDWLLTFLLWGAKPCDLAGIDVSESRIAQARLRLPDASLFAGDARALPFATGSIDLVTQFTVFTSVLDTGVKRAIAEEMRRVVRKDGLMLWYDFLYDNPRNPDVRGIGKQELTSLFPGCPMEFRKVTLAPPLARRTVRVSWAFSLCLEALPLLRTHCLALIRPRTAR